MSSLYSNRHVYIIRDGLLRSIPSRKTFEAMGLRFDNVRIVNAAEFSALRIGEAIPRAVE